MTPSSDETPRDTSFKSSPIGTHPTVRTFDEDVGLNAYLEFLAQNDFCGCGDPSLAAGRIDRFLAVSRCARAQCKPARRFLADETDPHKPERSA